MGAISCWRKFKCLNILTKGEEHNYREDPDVPVNLSTNKLKWGMTETLFLSLTLNPVWIINQTTCSSPKTEQSSVKVTVVRCLSWSRAGSRWVTIHFYLLRINSKLCALKCLCDYGCVGFVCMALECRLCRTYINDRLGDEWDRKSHFHFGMHNSITVTMQACSQSCEAPTQRH